MKILLRHPQYGHAALYSNMSRPVFVVNIVAPDVSCQAHCSEL